jgi:hypothetical protein
MSSWQDHELKRIADATSALNAGSTLDFRQREP